MISFNEIYLNLIPIFEYMNLKEKNKEFLINIHAVFAWQDDEGIFHLRTVSEYAISNLDQEINKRKKNKESFSDEEINKIIFQFIEGFHNLYKDSDFCLKEVNPQSIIFTNHDLIKLSEIESKNEVRFN